MPARSHGHTSGGYSRTYLVWKNMLRRCRSPRSQDWPLYGGRGIRVCDRWLKFPAFLADMGEAPTQLSLDRIDNDRGYELSNCRWSTATEQVRNRRGTVRIEYQGECLPLQEWCNRIGAVSYSTAHNRIRAGGWDPVEAFLLKPNAVRNNDRHWDF